MLSLSLVHGQGPSDAAAPPPTLPAVDGVNGKVDVFGGAWWSKDDSRTSGFYGAAGSLTMPLAHRWGAQLDAAVGRDDGAGDVSGAGHVFWRDPAVGLVGAYGSYTYVGGLAFGDAGSVAMGAAAVAAEGQFYWDRWIFTAAAGVQMVSFSGLPPGWGGAPTRFFDTVTAAYYVDDDVQLWVGHRYAFGLNGLALGFENGIALGGGRMASLFGDALLAEGGSAGVRGGVRLYFGRRDKTLIDRHRQDDPPAAIQAGGCGYGYHRGASGQCVGNRPGANARPAPYHPGCWRNSVGELRCY